MTESGRRQGAVATDSRGTMVVGLLADPDTPAEITAWLADELPGLLADQVDGDTAWDVRTMTHPVTASVQDPEEVLRAVADQSADAGWDVGVYLTDLPMQHGDRPILVDVDHERRVAGLSLPGFGPFLQHRKVRNAVVRLVGDLVGEADAGLEHEQHHPSSLGRTLAKHLHPVRVVRDGDGRHTQRYVTSRRRGRARLLAGMVRTNQPWRLVLGMRTALAAVLGTSAYLTINSTIWQLAVRYGVGKLVLTMLASVALMVAWIISAHHLWERDGDEDGEDRTLFNASTVLTLSIGVTVMFVAVYVLTLLASLFFLDPAVFASGLGRAPGLGDHLVLAWLATGLATIAGALGSGLDGEDAVRRAAYGYRERRRRDEIGQDDESDGEGTSSS